MSMTRIYSSFWVFIADLCCTPIQLRLRWLHFNVSAFTEYGLAVQLHTRQASCRYFWLYVFLGIKHKILALVTTLLPSLQIQLNNRKTLQIFQNWIVPILYYRCKKLYSFAQKKKTKIFAMLYAFELTKSITSGHPI